MNQDALNAALLDLSNYATEQARVADANAYEWQPDLLTKGLTNVNAAYRTGMWYAYRDVLNRIPQLKEINP